VLEYLTVGWNLIGVVVLAIAAARAGSVGLVIVFYDLKRRAGKPCTNAAAA
jgi:hypothetical protein